MRNDNEATYELMANHLIAYANQQGVNIAEVKDPRDLDDLFQDGGCARLDHFGDLADTRALLAGQRGSLAFDAAKRNMMWAAWDVVQQKLRATKGKIKVSELLSPAQISECLTIFDKYRGTEELHARIYAGVIEPNLACLQAKLGDKSDPWFIAYLIVSALYDTARETSLVNR